MRSKNTFQTCDGTLMITFARSSKSLRKEDSERYNFYVDDVFRFSYLTAQNSGINSFFVSELEPKCNYVKFRGLNVKQRLYGFTCNF